MGDFEPDKGRRHASHLIWSRRGPYARSLTGLAVPQIEPVRPLPGASGCEGPLATTVAAVPWGDPDIAGWNPSAPVFSYHSFDEVDYVDPDIAEGIFLDRSTQILNVPVTLIDYPPPATPAATTFGALRNAREPALEDDPDSTIEVPMHHNARILRVDDTRQDAIYYQYPSMFPDPEWPPLPIQLKDVPGYARNPCHAVIDCCEDPADPSIVRPTWFFNGVQFREVYESFITSGQDRHVFMLESVYSPWTPAEIDDDPSVLNRPDRPGFDERDPTFMERQRGNLITLKGGGSTTAPVPLNDPSTWQDFIDTVEAGFGDRFDWALVEGESNLYHHSIFENHVFVQNHEVDHVDLVMRNLTFPFRFDGGAGTPAEIDDDPSVLNRPDRPGYDERDPTFMERQRGNLIAPSGHTVGDREPVPLNDPFTWQQFIDTVNSGHSAYRFDWALVEGESNLYRHSIFENHVFVQNHEVDHVDLVMRNLTFPFRFQANDGTSADPSTFQYGTRADRTQMIPFRNAGPTLRMHLYRPRMRWWPYDAVDDPGGGAGYWRVEIPLIDFYDPVEAFEYRLAMDYAEDGSPVASYDSGFVDISGSPPATFSDLIDLAIDAANASSSFDISRQPDDGGNAILHITRFDAPAGPGDTLDFDLMYSTEDNDFQIVNLFDIEEYQLPIIDSPKGWCFDAVDEVESVVIEGPDDFSTPGFSRGIKYLDVWGKEMPSEWFDGTTREVGGSGGGTGPYFDELLVARIRIPITIPPGVWAIGFSWEWSGYEYGSVESAFQVEHIFIPDGGPRCIPWMSPTGGSDCALGSLPQLD